MCTVVYLPEANGSFCIGHNRDESIRRKPALSPRFSTIAGQKVLAPIDSYAGGTWIAATEQKAVLLFNGAFEKHTHQPPYNRSRGSLVFEAFKEPTFNDYAKKIDLNNVEPFTVIYVDRLDEARLYQLIWDGNDKHINILKNRPLLWCSMTLFTHNQLAEKRKTLDLALQKDDFNIETYMQTTEGEGAAILDRGRIKTLSTTVLSYTNSQPAMKYIRYD